MYLFLVPFVFTTIGFLAYFGVSKKKNWMISIGSGLFAGMACRTIGVYLLLLSPLGESYEIIDSTYTLMPMKIGNSTVFIATILDKENRANLRYYYKDNDGKVVERRVRHDSHRPYNNCVYEDEDMVTATVTTYLQIRKFNPPVENFLRNNLSDREFCLTSRKEFHIPLGAFRGF